MGSVVGNPQVDCVQKATNANNPGSYDRTAVPDLLSRGNRWTDARIVYTGFNTVLPPNGPSCLQGSEAGVGSLVSAGSYHSGGVQVTMGDGSVKFISETINAGTQTAGPQTSGKSPYGTWGALGTRAGGEVETDF